MSLILLGAPGAGKGTQAEKISNQLGFTHISTGDILRNAVSKETPLGVQAKRYMDSGELVPDQLMIDLICDILPRDKGFLLDGFPRTLDQAKALDEMLLKEKIELSRVVYIDVKQEELVSRMLSRGRNDDNVETIQKRLQVFQNQTSPLEAYYEMQQKLVKIDGNQDVDAVTQDILKWVS